MLTFITGASTASMHTLSLEQRSLSSKYGCLCFEAILIVQNFPLASFQLLCHTSSGPMVDHGEHPAIGTKASKRKTMWQMDWTCKFSDNNPKKEKSQAFGRFAVYKTATTIREAINLGACMRDLDADFKAGHLTCEEASAALAEDQAAGEVTTCNPTSRKTRRRSWTKLAAASDVVEPSVLPLPMLAVEVQTSDVAPDDLPLPISSL